MKKYYEKETSKPSKFEEEVTLFPNINLGKLSLETIKRKY